MMLCVHVYSDSILVMFDRLIFELVSQYLGEFETLKSLQFVCKNAYGHIEDTTETREIISCPKNKRFKEACVRGRIDIAMYFVRRRHRRSRTSSVIKAACASGQLGIVKWLIGIYYRPQTVDVTQWFSTACEHDQFHVAQWLYHKEKVCEYALWKYLGQHFVYVGVMRVMWGLTFEEIYRYNTFILACKNGRIDIAKKMNVTDRRIVSFAIKQAHEHDHLDMMRYLCEKDDQIILE